MGHSVSQHGPTPGQPGPTTAGYRLVEKYHHVPHGQHYSLFVKFNLETDGFHGSSDVDSVTIHGRPGQVGITAWLRKGARLALDAHGQGKGKGAIVGQHGLFFNGDRYFLTLFGVQCFDKHGMLVASESLLELVLGKLQIGRAGPITAPSVTPEATFQMGPRIEHNLLGGNYLGVNGAHFARPFNQRGKIVTHLLLLSRHTFPYQRARRLQPAPFSIQLHLAEGVCARELR